MYSVERQVQLSPELPFDVVLVPPLLVSLLVIPRLLVPPLLVPPLVIPRLLVPPLLVPPLVIPRLLVPPLLVPPLLRFQALVPMVQSQPYRVCYFVDCPREFCLRQLVTKKAPDFTRSGHRIV